MESTEILVRLYELEKRRTGIAAEKQLAITVADYQKAAELRDQEDELDQKVSEIRRGVTIPIDDFMASLKFIEELVCRLTLDRLIEALETPAAKDFKTIVLRLVANRLQL